MSDTLLMLRESVSRALAQRPTPADTLAAEAAGMDAGTWDRLRQLGVAGRDADEMDLELHAAVLRETAYAGALVPYAESEVLGRWLARAAGLGGDADLITVCVLDAGEARLHAGRVSLALDPKRRIAWGRHAQTVLFSFEFEGRPQVAAVPGSQIEWRRAANMASEPHDLAIAGALPLETTEVAEVPAASGPAAVRARGALSRAIQMEGAIARANALTLQYARDRKQFSRALAQYQVIQSYLAAMAGELCATNAAVQRCVAGGGSSVEDIAAAKVRAGQAARVVTAHAHQVHGAIGFTREYPLQLWTRRLWAWREEYGNESSWARELGARLVARGADALWPYLTATSRA